MRDRGVEVRRCTTCWPRRSAVAFPTPVATPANMMVMGPAGYRFGTTGNSGCLVGLFFVVAVGLVPLVWQF